MIHTCHAHACFRKVEPAKLMCYAHWKKLPKAAQDVIWREYRPGQEIDKRPSTRYLVAQAVAVAWVASVERHKDLPQLVGDVLRKIVLGEQYGLAPRDGFQIVADMDGDEITLSDAQSVELDALVLGVKALREANLSTSMKTFLEDT